MRRELRAIISFSQLSIAQGNCQWQQTVDVRYRRTTEIGGYVGVIDEETYRSLTSVIQLHSSEAETVLYCSTMVLL